MNNKNIVVFNSWYFDLDIHNLDDEARYILSDKKNAITAFNSIFKSNKNKLKETNFEQILDGLIFYIAVKDTCIEINNKLKKTNVVFEFVRIYETNKEYERLYLGIIPRNKVRNNSPQSVRVVNRDLSCNAIPLLYHKDFKLNGYELYPISIHTIYNQLWNSIDARFFELLTDNFWTLKNL